MNAVLSLADDVRSREAASNGGRLVFPRLTEVVDRKGDLMRCVPVGNRAALAVTRQRLTDL